ncbi:hypothetical protein NECAME_08204 [Necator americanus]|uniref:BZIP domain-containing protein n=1 Tax=Necator americanus TaxID=51031 RepID=W2TLN6_NECAM|nr:hypothetical protein NECAME_08204 [Necator americanus]ETN82051.1 hypothetical protein NECAME_08204 [Necator americanus]
MDEARTSVHLFHVTVPCLQLSAQESRRKRKEYMDTLESRCQAYFNENTQLRNRVRQLEMSNQKLLMQVKKFQDMMGTNPSHSDINTNH